MCFLNEERHFGQAGKILINPEVLDQNNNQTIRNTVD